MIIRPFRDGDQEPFRELFRECFGKEMSAEEWAWKYRTSYLGTSSVVAEDKGRIIAHYGGLKMRFCWNGRTFDAYQGCDAMTHPEYQSRGIIVKTALGFYENNPDREFMFGFPSERHATLSERWLGWAKHAFISEMVKGLTGVSPRKLLWRVETGWNKIAAGEADALWESTKDSGNLSLEKKSSYIFWRYRDNPGRQYEVVLFRGFFRKDLRAYAVVAQQGDELRVLDLIASESGQIKNILSCLERRAAAKRLKTIRLWMNRYGSGGRDLIKAGYREEKGIPLALRTFEGSSLAPDFFFRHYNYSMGDYDAA